MAELLLKTLHQRFHIFLGFEALVRSTGIRFSTWENANGEVEYSSMTGVKWRKVLNSIGPLIRSSSNVFPEEIKEPLASLFDEFNNFLHFVANCGREDAELVAQKANKWVCSYISMGCRVTPYVHLFVTHLPFSVKLFGGMSRLSGELVEAANDSIKKTHLRKTDHRSPKLTLLTQLRIELQDAQARLEAHQNPTSRKRKPTAQHPWQGTGLKEREKRKRLEEEEERASATAAQQSPYANLSDAELKDLIYARGGEKTRKQKRVFLLDILKRMDG